MGRRSRRPTISERDAFILKLIAFRKELTPAEQRLLDAMALAAFREQGPGDVRGFACLTLEDLRPTAEDSTWMTTYEHIGAMIG
jgi:hypothetical protein